MVIRKEPRKQIKAAAPFSGRKGKITPRAYIYEGNTQGRNAVLCGQQEVQ